MHTLRGKLAQLSITVAATGHVGADDLSAQMCRTPIERYRHVRHEPVALSPNAGRS